MMLDDDDEKVTFNDLWPAIMLVLLILGFALSVGLLVGNGD